MFYLIYLVIFGDIARQTDWMGGDSVLGPVNDWGTQYWMSDSVTAATPGQVSLIATSWNYSNWVKHVIEPTGVAGLCQGFQSADIDNDGDKDLVAHSNNQAVWYENQGNWTYVKHIIGTATAGGYPNTWPYDLDGDGDIDVVVCSPTLGVGWFENLGGGSSWAYHQLDNGAYYRVSACDVELDGDIDLIASFITNPGYSIYLFRNNGSMVFNKEVIFSATTGYEGWRSYPADFNADGFPDVYSVEQKTYIFINNGTGQFNQVYYYSSGASKDFDGAWPSDIDMDGDLDLVTAQLYHTPFAFYGHLNDGTGNNYTLQLLHDAGIDYMDGAISQDIDLDGLPDIVGVNTKVGWFRQTSPLNFTGYFIDNLSSAHWVYAEDLDQACVPDIDLLVSDWGAHIVYENKMLQGFASVGYLESSILEVTPATSAPCTLKYFAYNACVPIDTTLCFYWRAGVDSTATVNNPWNGPYYSTVGINVVDSFALSGTGRMFQYKAEFRRAPDDIAVLYEIWLTYECPLGVEEMGRHTGLLPLQFMDGKLVLYLPQKDRVWLAIYDIAGRLAKNVFDGHLPSGVHEFEAPKSNGIYFARLQSTAGTRTLKFIKL